MYQGKRQEQNNTLSPNFGPIGNTVVRLCQRLEGKNHKIILDNLFTTITLLSYLKQKKIHVLGTIRSNRLKDAKSKLTDSKALTKSGRGSLSIATSNDNITVVRWVDRNIVHMVSTFAAGTPTDTVKRWDVKNHAHIDIESPYAVACYNKFMGGVDMTEQMVTHYPHTIKSKKFYLRMFFHFYNVALVNAWILYKRDTERNISFGEFKASIATTVIELGSQQRKSGSPSNTPDHAHLKKRQHTVCSADVRLDGIAHYPEKKRL
ncbi:piggyBac transposable element-derived protein 3-like [Schistocerca nitens]|uniref:piggyBac transposable element-derived protein 3-like n=1 Tax=Schistocerca nitens TaxID=7011 RepID=UPI0021197A80|nr:piggyBac transposable element-derived protein 3-like [Schistocerca nitens]